MAKRQSCDFACSGSSRKRNPRSFPLPGTFVGVARALRVEAVQPRTDHTARCSPILPPDDPARSAGRTTVSNAAVKIVTRTSWCAYMCVYIYTVFSKLYVWEQDFWATNHLYLQLYSINAGFLKSLNTSSASPSLVLRLVLLCSAIRWRVMVSHCYCQPHFQGDE